MLKCQRSNISNSIRRSPVIKAFMCIFISIELIIPKAHVDNYRVSEASNESGSTIIINGLHKLKINAGIARQQQFTERQRRMLNQYTTETIGRYTLTDIFRGKSEYLWICPTCNEDDRTTKLNDSLLFDFSICAQLADLLFLIMK
jgi:hypothetical protein